MVRLLLYFLLGYVVWKVIQVVTQAISGPPRDRKGVFTQKPPQQQQQNEKKSETYKDIRDADFEELPPEEKK